MLIFPPSRTEVMIPCQDSRAPINCLTFDQIFQLHPILQLILDMNFGYTPNMGNVGGKFSVCIISLTANWIQTEIPFFSLFSVGILSCVTPSKSRCQTMRSRRSCKVSRMILFATLFLFRKDPMHINI